MSALGYLFIHELYHLSFDMSITLLECILNDFNIYRSYYINYYKRTLLTDNCIEEALANRMVSERDRYLKLNKDKLYVRLKVQHAGYNRFDDYKSSNLHLGNQELMYIAFEYSSNIIPGGLNLDSLINWPNQVSYFRGFKVPLYLVKSKFGPKIRIIGAKIP